MKLSRPKEDRVFDQAQRGIAAQQIIDSELIGAWFDAEEKRLVRDMLTAEIADDAKRRDCALQIKTLRALALHIEAQAALGQSAIKEMDKQNVR